MKLALKKPIELTNTGDGKPLVISDLVFREEVCAGDFRHIKVNSLTDPLVDDMLKVASRLCGQPEAVLNKLSSDDFDTVLAAVLGFLRAGRETPTSSSP